MIHLALRDAIDRHCASAIAEPPRLLQDALVVVRAVIDRVLAEPLPRSLGVAR